MRHAPFPPPPPPPSLSPNPPLLLPQPDARDVLGALEDEDEDEDLDGPYYEDIDPPGSLDAFESGPLYATAMLPVSTPPASRRSSRVLAGGSPLAPPPPPPPLHHPPLPTRVTAAAAASQAYPLVAGTVRHNRLTNLSTLLADDDAIASLIEFSTLSYNVEHILFWLDVEQFKFVCTDDAGRQPYAEVGD